MENITVLKLENYPEEAVLDLYRSVGWSAYYQAPETLRRAFDASLCIFAAYEDSRLVGLIRAVGDGQTILFIQDILVHPGYQRRGIGRMLMAAMVQRYAHVRQIQLLTDDQPNTVGFYQAVGFAPVEQLHAKAFIRTRS